MNINNSWVEKYRPKKLDDITSQKDVVISLRKSLKTLNIPHLIFFGPSGCGKTSSILALSRELFGDEYFNNKIIELNASDERGINVVREKIKTYAKHKVANNFNGPKFKIIILDEADSMTPDSQFALRRIMEEYSSITRFCIICNYHNKIIDPIVSRCSLFRFNPISNNEIISKLKYIIKNENMHCSDNILKKIVKICRGDLRKAINFLQRCHNYFGDNINEILLDEISGIINNSELKNLIDLCIKKESQKVDEIVLKFYNNGYSLVNQILELHDLIIDNDSFSSIEKSDIIKKIVEIDQNLIKGCDEYIQFLRFCYYIMSIK